LECVVKLAYPDRIKWTYYNDSLPSNARAINNILIITNASQENAGMYVCKVTTTMRIYTAEVQLMVKPEDSYSSKAYLNNLTLENKFIIITNIVLFIIVTLKE